MGLGFYYFRAVWAFFFEICLQQLFNAQIHLLDQVVIPESMVAERIYA